MRDETFPEVMHVVFMLKVQISSISQTSTSTFRSSGVGTCLHSHTVYKCLRWQDDLAVLQCFVGWRCKLSDGTVYQPGKLDRYPRPGCDQQWIIAAVKSPALARCSPTPGFAKSHRITCIALCCNVLTGQTSHAGYGRQRVWVRATAGAVLAIDCSRCIKQARQEAADEPRHMCGPG